MNNQTKTLLGLAAVAGVGYYLFMQSKKAPASFANFDSDPVKMVSKCNGDYGKDTEGRYICCRAGYRSAQSDGKPCGSVGQFDDSGMDMSSSFESLGEAL
jgi:hypothetical protein